MATSIDSFVVQGIPQELDVSYCKPCLKLGYVQQATGFCLQCIEFYCQSCLHTHSEISATQHHTLLSGPDMPSVEEVKQKFCNKHEDKLKDMYCFNHCLLVCLSCCMTTHKRCNVESLPEACTSIDVTAEEEKFKEHVAELQKISGNVRQSMEENINDLEKQKDTMLTEAETFRDKVIQHANQCFEDFKIKVNNTVSERSAMLSRHIKTTIDISSKARCIWQDIQQNNLKETEEARHFLQFHSHIETTRRCLQTLETIQQELIHVDMKAKFNQNIVSLFERQTKFVEVVECVTKVKIPVTFTDYKCRRRRGGSKRESRGSMKLGDKRESMTIQGGKQAAPTKASMLDPFLVKSKDDIKECNIRGLAVINGGNVLLSDYSNMALKLFSPDGYLVSAIQLKDSPKDIAIINDSEAVASVCNDQIGIIDITNCCQISVTRHINLKNNVHGITAYKNNIIFASDSDPPFLQMINRTGEVQWTVSHDTDNNQLFLGPEFLTTCSVSGNAKVIVTDSEKQTITVLDARSGSDARVCDVGEKEPVGITADDNGNVYVCYKSGEIYVWHEAMKQERCIVPAHLSVLSPFAIAYNKKCNILYVTSNSKEEKYCNFVHRYRLS